MNTIVILLVGAVLGIAIYTVIDFFFRATPPPEHDFSGDLHNAVVRASAKHNHQKQS